MTEIMFTALMPMKGNSERVPNKNFKVIGGKPLCLWMVEALRNTPSIANLVINTDARQKLAACGVVADEFITIRDRPSDLCGDLVSMNLVLENDIAATDAEHFIMTHTTNPLISSSTLEAAGKKYVENLATYDSLFSVTRHQARFFDHNFSPINHRPEELLRTQDLPAIYEENSCIYVFSRKSFQKQRDRVGEFALGFETPANESIDIDTSEDWDLAEAMLERGLGQ